jgi:hypothetical protein
MMLQKCYSEAVNVVQGERADRLEGHAPASCRVRFSRALAVAVKFVLLYMAETWAGPGLAKS